MIRWAHQHAGFFKHADRDHDRKLEGFEPSHGDDILYIAVADLGRLRGRKPIEADAFELWFLAMRDLLGPASLGEIEGLSGITKVPRAQQVLMGRAFLTKARKITLPAPHRRR